MDVFVAERLAVVSDGYAASSWVAFVTGLLALLAVLPSWAWSWARHLDTAVHEGGHALAAYLTGRFVIGVWLYPDASGSTWHRGRPNGLGRITISAAGYTGPSVVGLVSAALLDNGKVTSMLILAMLGLAFLLFVVRNGFGELVVASTGVLVILVDRHSPAWVQAGFAYFLTWFLLLSGPKSVLVLHRLRRAGVTGSDADTLAGITPIPGLLWVLIFGAVGVVCLFEGAGLLLG